jgi:YD repeat-containing protein
MRKIYVIIICIFFCSTIQSQISERPLSVLSPNATSINTYGDIPVSLYTGTPNIDILLFEEKIKEFNLPISLQYHAAGVRPDQRAGWTGLGWTLNTGGVISRTVNDMPDEYHNPNYHMGDKAGYLHAYQDKPLILHGDGHLISRYGLRDLAQSNRSLKDTEPDEFTFSFGKYRGKFYPIGRERYRIQCPYPVTVTFDWGLDAGFDIPFNKQGTRAQSYGYSKCLRGFTIMTEDGTKYVFGEDINAIDFSIDFFGQAMSDWTATSWYLTKIILPSKHEINFKYERGDFINQMYIAVHHDLGSKTESSGGIFNPQPGCSSSNFSSVEASYQGNLISPVYLKEIATDNNTITFDRSLSNEMNYSQSIYSYQYGEWSRASSGYPFLPILQSNNVGYPNCLSNLKWYKLDKITVKEKSSNLQLKSISFSYNNQSAQRLVLNEVRESDKGSHKFYYDNIASLPPYLANKTDHWGFFNNTYASLDYNNYYSYRNPNASVAKYGTLNKIEYPTGGYTEFIFEPHYYRKQLKLKRWEGVDELTSNQLAGGLRIKQIKNSSTPSGPAQLVKEYFYVSDYIQNPTNPGKSSGVLGGQVQYYFTDYTVYAFNDRDVRRKMSMFSSISVLPSCHNTLGSHIGYTEVIEKNADNSFTRHQFSNFDNGYLDEKAIEVIQESRTPYEPYGSKAMERGLLLFKEDYNSNIKKIRSKAIVYEKDNHYQRVVNMIKARYRNVCPGTAVSYDEGAFWQIWTYLMLPKTETETFYDPLNGSALQAITTNYTNIGYNYDTALYPFPPTNLVKNIKMTNSDGYVSQVSFKYCYNYSTVAVTDPVIREMQRLGMQPLLEKTTTKRGKNIIESTVYGKTGSVFYPKQVKVIYVDGQERTLFSHEIADSFGNPVYTVVDGAPDKITLWGYNGQFIIAEIDNATYDQVRSALGVAPESLSSAGVPNFTLIEHLRDNPVLQNARITTYKYRPSVGIIEAKIPSGIITYYDYDSFGRLKETYIRDSNGTKQVIQKYDYHYQNQ